MSIGAVATKPLPSPVTPTEHWLDASACRANVLYMSPAGDETAAAASSTGAALGATAVVRAGDTLAGTCEYTR